MKFFITILFFYSILLSKDVNYKKNGCNIPDLLIHSIQLTENKNSYPYYIRTNSKNTLAKFKDIVSFFSHRKTSDEMLIDCFSKKNCTLLSEILILNGIDNLDLGLFQINYKSFPTKLSTYFDREKSYFFTCKIVNQKIYEAGAWSWEVLASYHSKTPSLNKKYKNRLIKNYEKLSKKYLGN